MQDGIKITVPSRKSWVGIAVTSVYLLFLWSFQVWMLVAFLFVSPKSPRGDDASALLLMLPLTTLVAAFTLYLTYTFLWSLIGNEIILVKQGSLAARRRLLFFGRFNEYLAEHISNLRVQPTTVWYGHAFAMLNLFWGIPKGPIAFDYGAKTFHIASGATQVEAEHIVGAIVRRFPQYADAGRAPRNTEHPK